MKRFPPPLRFSIPGVFFALGVVLLAISVHFELQASDTRAEAAVVQRAQLLSLVLSTQLEKSYRERRTTDTRAIVLQANADRASRLTILFDDRRRALESAPLGTAGRPLADTPFAEDVGLLDEMADTSSAGLRVATHGDHVNCYMPVRLASQGGELVSTGTGILAMQLDLRPTLSEGRARVARRAIGVAVALATICASLWLFFQIFLLRRVQALIATANKFAAGDSAARTDIHGGDELAHLATAFDRMAEAISVNRAALVEAVRARDEFLMVASHELRTPCTSLRLAVELLHRGVTGAPAKKMLDIADRESQVLTSLVDRLLDVSRIAEAPLDVVLEPVDLTTTVHEAVAALATSLKESGSSIVMDGREAIVGRWDRLRLSEMVTNLIVNAIKYGRGRPIHVHVQRMGDTAKLAVEDEGTGIAPERRSAIFGRFERAVSLRHYGGLGLGLYIARRIVEALGGTIRFTSEVDVGSTFVVELPLEGPVLPAV